MIKRVHCQECDLEDLEEEGESFELVREGESLELVREEEASSDGLHRPCKVKVDKLAGEGFAEGYCNFRKAKEQLPYYAGDAERQEEQRRQ